MFVSLLDTLSPIKNIVSQPSISKRSLPSTPTLHPSPSPPEPPAFSLPPNHVQDTAFLILQQSECLGKTSWAVCLRHFQMTLKLETLFVADMAWRILYPPPQLNFLKSGAGARQGQVLS
ncbi:hypothetical protein FOZ60_010432 [Perkinsus olseni]|uniref:Uncharacterized protein n=1 Tax=Perkinsus olseni TaxID=32597 RepID=A0A7J6NFA9_PEROL|nr:hypothetical protein FOZ60_010432 [Perkinsus olseni]